MFGTVLGGGGGGGNIKNKNDQCNLLQLYQLHVCQFAA